MQVEQITPEIARRYLLTQLTNRRVRSHHVTALATIMTAGAWELNGETIKFNRAGELIDGQHRLLAVCQSQRTIETYVIHELSATARNTVDTGLKRSPGDLLGLQGYSNATNLAAASRWIWRYEQGQMAGYRFSPSIAVLRDVIEAHPELKNSIAYGVLLQRLVTRSLGSALHCLFSERDGRLAERCYAALKDGENLMRTSSLFMLRNRLIANSQTKARIPEFECAALIIKCWNALRKGETIKTLRWRSKEPASEPYPVIE